MKRPSLCRLLLLALPIAACDRDPRPAMVDTTADTTAAVSDSSTAAGSRSGWAPGLGPLLLVAGEQREASAVFPSFSDSTLTDTTTFDTSILAGMDVDLFSRSGLAGRGRLRAVPARLGDDGCVAWPEAAVTITDSLASHAGWTVAFAAGRAHPLPLDSLESLTGADSARLTAEVSRLAS